MDGIFPENPRITVGSLVVMPSAGPLDDYSHGGFVSQVLQIVDGETALVEDQSGRLYAVEAGRLSVLDLEQC